MIKSLLSKGSYYFLGNVMARGIGFILFPLYAQKMLPADYAAVDLLNVFAAFCAVTLSLEIMQGYFREFNEHEGEELRSLISTTFWFIFITVSSLCLVFLFFSDGLSRLITGQDDCGLAYKYCLITIWLNAITSVGFNYLRLTFRAKLFVAVSFGQLLIAAGSTFYFLWYEGMLGEGIFLGIIAGNSVSAIVLMFIIRKSIILRIDKRQLKKLLGFSLPIVPASIGGIMAMYMDRIAVKELMTPTDLGLLGTAYRFASLSTLVTGALVATLTPLIYKHYKESRTPHDISRLFTLLIYVTIMICFAAHVIAGPIVEILLTPEFHPAALYISGLLGANFVAQFYLFAPGLAIAKKTISVAIFSVLGAIVNLGLNIILIPSLGLYGVVIATVSSALLMFLLYAWYGHKSYPIPYDWSSLSWLLGLTFVAVTAFIIVNQPGSDNFINNVIIFFCLAALSTRLVWKKSGVTENKDDSDLEGV